MNEEEAEAIIEESTALNMTLEEIDAVIIEMSKK